ncbi:MAG TPA: sulfatase-like hydrolase/transferase [Candidatus Brocadiia bacterium]|mgnify:CR=1 FL=1|nr:sulfatase-like hydrolase/transferase [Candidatus Brocadiia bacterium]
MAEATRKPNILFITTDQQRWDTVGAYGRGHVRTPCLDRLAGEGVLFERAYAQNVVCIPSRACMQTGRYTHQHGVRYMEDEIDLTPGLPAHEVTVMKRLQEAGYVTGATGKIHMMPERDFDWMEIVGGKGARWTQSTGLPIGPAPLGAQYAAWVEAREPGAYERIYAQRRQPDYKRNICSMVNCLPLELYVETYILEKSIEFIRANKERPFFLWCGFCGPHGPHDPPASHANLYDPREVELPATLGADLSGKPRHIAGRAQPELARRDGGMAYRRYMAWYYCLCTLIDEYVGKLVDTLRREALLDNTLIVYVSDHGEMLGDYDMYGKGNFYEPVSRVPMIARPPGGCARRRVGRVAETMDVAATFLDYAGVAQPREMQARSFRPALEAGEYGHEAALSEYTTNDQKINGKCLVTERFKYVYWDAGEGGELYDLAEDPLERRNLYYEGSHRETRDRMAEMLLERLMQSERGYLGGREGHY